MENTTEMVMFENVRVANNRLILPEDTSFDEWEDIGRKLKAAEGAIQFLIGDWINFGEGHFGDRYLIAMAKTGFTHHTLTNVAYVSNKFNGHGAMPREGIATRHNLPFTHHQEVAMLPGIVAERLLDEAEEKHLTSAELRAEVREWQAEHGPSKNETLREFVFSWVKEPHVAAMLDGMEAIKEGVSTLIHDQRDPDTAKYLLDMVRKLMIETIGSINQVLGDDQ